MHLVGTQTLSEAKLHREVSDENLGRLLVAPPSAVTQSFSTVVSLVREADVGRCRASKGLVVTPLPWATGCEGASVNFRAAVHLAQSRLLRPPDSKLRMMLAGPPRDWFGDLSGCGLQAGGGNKSASKRLILLAPKLIRGGREGGTRQSEMNSPCSKGFEDSGTQSAAGRVVQGCNSSRRASEKWEVTVHFASDSLSVSLAASPVDCLAEVKCSSETPAFGIPLSRAGWS